MSQTIPKTVHYEGKDVPVAELKTIDFEKLLSNEPDEVERLLKCCQDEGFFYLDLRGIDGRRTLDDQQRLLSLMARFFHSSFDEKNEIGLPEQKHG